MAAPKKTDKNRLLLIGLGTAILGTVFLSWDTITGKFKGDENKPKLPPPPPSNKAAGNKPQPKPETVGPNLDKKLTKGLKGDEVKRLQVIINEIEAMRGKKSITANGKVIKFPLDVDGDLGPSTFAAALDCFPSLKSQGYITLHQARLKWAYSLGYYDKPFSATLVNSPRIKEYQVQYKMGSEQGKGEPKKTSSSSGFMFQMP